MCMYSADKPLDLIPILLFNNSYSYDSSANAKSTQSIGLLSFYFATQNKVHSICGKLQLSINQIDLGRKRKIESVENERKI